MKEYSRKTEGIKAASPAAFAKTQGRRSGHGPMMGPPGMMGGDKPKDFKSAFRLLLSALKPYRGPIVLSLLMSVGSTVLAIVGPKQLGKATTRLFEGLMAKLSQIPGAAIDFAYIGNILLWMSVIYTASMVLGYITGFIMTGISAKVGYQFRLRIAAKIGRMPLGSFDRMTHGEVLSRITNDVDTVFNSLNQGLGQLLSSVTMIIGSVIMMFSISWLMTLAALVVLPLSGILIGWIVKISQKYFVSQQADLGKVNSHVEEMYGGHQVMKAYNGEEKSVAAFRGLNTRLYGSAWKSQFLSGMMMPIMMFIGNIGYVLVCILGGFLAVRKAITVGDIQAFIQYVRMFTQPVSQIATIANVFQSTMAASERVFEFLNMPEETPDTTVPADPGAVAGHVDFEHVHFGYSPEKIIINDFNAEIPQGCKVAIVGPTGAGKTTMVKLLMRFYDVNEGSILVDDIDIRGFSRSGLRGLFGMVLQDTWLFNGTIRENIRYGRLDATDEEVEAAAKAAYADHFIRTQPNGYDMVINEEANNISQGEKQLLTIARAILSDPRILILDEATSSVDTRTEILIQKAMLDLMKGRTSFIIAHRLSTIRDADLILVMHDGDIVEQGTHAQLLADEGFYANLYNSQFS